MNIGKVDNLYLPLNFCGWQRQTWWKPRTQNYRACKMAASFRRYDWGDGCHFFVQFGNLWEVPNYTEDIPQESHSAWEKVKYFLRDTSHVGRWKCGRRPQSAGKCVMTLFGRFRIKVSKAILHDGIICNPFWRSNLFREIMGWEGLSGLI